MNEADHTGTAGRKPRRWGFWVFMVANVAGAIVAIPLLVAVFPLLGIWWDTRSQESFKHRQAAAALEAPAKSLTAAKDAVGAGSNLSPNAEPSMAGLTNNLNLIGKLNETELDKIVARQFGKQKQSQADPEKFDRDSAVFHKITRTVATLNGKDYFCYEVDLVDENGNHKVHVDAFDKPDLDYERSMAALNLVNSNPQLKKIYKAFSHVLAEQSASPAKSGAVATGAKPSIRLEKDGPPERP